MALGCYESVWAELVVKLRQNKSESLGNAFECLIEKSWKVLPQKLTFRHCKGWSKSKKSNNGVTASVCFKL